MKRLIIIMTVDLLLIFLYLNAASQNKKANDGIKVVINNEKGIWESSPEKRIELEKDLEIGVLEGDKNKMFYKISDIKVDSEGNIYVLERGNKRVQKFDNKGNFILTIGAEGQGPGEFKHPIALFVTRDYYIYVLDSENLRVSKFNPNGIFVSSFKPKNKPIDFVVDSKHNIIILEDGDPNFKLFKYNSKGSLISSFGEIVAGKNIFETAILNQGCISIDDNDNVYISYLQPYKIQKYNAKDNLVAEYSRKLPYEIIKPMTNVEDRGDVKAVQFNVHTRLTADIDVKGDRIYHLITSGNNLFMEGRYVDIFDSSGIYLQKIELKHLSRKFCVDRLSNFYFIVESSGFKSHFDKDTSILIPRVEKYKIK